MILTIKGNDKRIIALARELCFRSKKCGFSMELTSFIPVVKESIVDETKDIEQIEYKELVTENPVISIIKPIVAKVSLNKKSGRPKVKK